MSCCGGNQRNKAGHQNNYSDGNSHSGSKLPIFIGAILLAVLIYYLVR